MRIHLKLFFAVACLSSAESFLNGAPASASLRSRWGMTEKRKTSYSPSYVPLWSPSDVYPKDPGGIGGAKSDSSSSPEATIDDSDHEDEVSRADYVVCGGGPAGLLSAIMMARKFPEKKVQVYDRLPEPPSPTDERVWNEFDKHYLIGLGGRAITSLEKFGVWKDVKKYTVPVPGRKDWVPKAQQDLESDDGYDDGVETMLTDRKYITHVLPRDKLASAIHQHILYNYGGRIELNYGYDVMPVNLGGVAGDGYGDESPVLVDIVPNSFCRPALNSDDTFLNSQQLGKDTTPNESPPLQDSYKLQDRKDILDDSSISSRAVFETSSPFSNEDKHDQETQSENRASPDRIRLPLQNVDDFLELHSEVEQAVIDAQSSPASAGPAKQKNPKVKMAESSKKITNAETSTFTKTKRGPQGGLDVRYPYGPMAPTQSYFSVLGLQTAIEKVVIDSKLSKLSESSLDDARDQQEVRVLKKRVRDFAGAPFKILQRFRGSSSEDLESTTNEYDSSESQEVRSSGASADDLTGIEIPRKARDGPRTRVTGTESIDRKDQVSSGSKVIASSTRSSNVKGDSTSPLEIRDGFRRVAGFSPKNGLQDAQTVSSSTSEATGKGETPSKIRSIFTRRNGKKDPQAVDRSTENNNSQVSFESPLNTGKEPPIINGFRDPQVTISPTATALGMDVEKPLKISNGYCKKNGFKDQKVLMSSSGTTRRLYDLDTRFKERNGFSKKNGQQDPQAIITQSTNAPQNDGMNTSFKGHNSYDGKNGSQDPQVVLSSTRTPWIGATVEIPQTRNGYRDSKRAQTVATADGSESRYKSTLLSATVKERNGAVLSDDASSRKENQRIIITPAEALVRLPFKLLNTWDSRNEQNKAVEVDVNLNLNFNVEVNGNTRSARRDGVVNGMDIKIVISQDDFIKSEGNKIESPDSIGKKFETMADQMERVDTEQPGVPIQRPLVLAAGSNRSNLMDKEDDNGVDRAKNIGEDKVIINGKGTMSNQGSEKSEARMILSNRKSVVNSQNDSFDDKKLTFDAGVIPKEEIQLRTQRVLVEGLLLAADGSVRTIASQIEEVDREVGVEEPFTVTRYKDDNERVYKNVGFKVPSSWKKKMNYAVRSKGGRLIFDALPANRKGDYVGIFLLQKNDPVAQENVDPMKFREFLDECLPQFSPLIDDENCARVAKKPPSKLPGFRYVAPRLHHRKRTVLLGDCAHTVKPYFGMGANSALEDVKVLGQCIDESPNDLGKAAVEYSNRRAEDIRALVEVSHNLDRPGFEGTITFLIPVIMDAIFNKLAPKFFKPNIISMIQNEEFTFQEAIFRKDIDRLAQLVSIATGFTGLVMASNFVAETLGSITGWGIG